MLTLSALVNLTVTAAAAWRVYGKAYAPPEADRRLECHRDTATPPHNQILCR